MGFPLSGRSGLVRVPRTTPCFRLSLSGGLSPLLTSGNCHRRSGSQQDNLPLASLCSGCAGQVPLVLSFLCVGGAKRLHLKVAVRTLGRSKVVQATATGSLREGLQQQRRSARRRGAGAAGQGSSQSVLRSSAFSLCSVFLPPCSLSRKVTPRSITVTAHLDRAPPAPQFGYSRDSV